MLNFSLSAHVLADKKKNLYGGFIKHNKLFITGGGTKMLATTFHQQFFLTFVTKIFSNFNFYHFSSLEL